jgi:uncharacterized membrane protein
MTTDHDPEDTDSAAVLFGVGLALVAGGIVRVLPFFGTAFPLNDGGLFGIMIQDLVDNGFLLPTSTTYNGLDIPFAYPPLAFYVAGFGHMLGVAIVDTLRGVPLLFSLATIIAVYWLAAGVLRSRSGGMLAALAFALLPRSYLFLITGGGLTRGLGFLLAIIALGLAWRFMQRRKPGWGAVGVLGLDAGLTALAHPQAAVFVATSIIVFLPWAVDRRVAVTRLAISALIGLAVVAAWLIPVIGDHGIEPLISAAQSGASGPEGLLHLLSLRFGDLLVFDVITIAALIGTVLALRRREFMLPGWLVAVWLVDSRAGYTFAMVPLALLTAYALLGLTRSWLPGAGTPPFDHIRKRPMATAIMIAVLSGLVVANYYSGLRPSSPLHGLDTEQLSALVWAGENTPDEAVFAVVTSGSLWANDATSEWFPALTDRRSAATVQGSEWLGPEVWQRHQDAYGGLQACARDVLPCVLAWSDTYDRPITHVFLPKGQLHGPSSEIDCCPAPRHSVQLVPGARVIYDGPGATIIELP